MKKGISTVLLTIAAVTGLSAAEVDHRHRIEEHRITQGVRSGTLTHHEAARLRGEEAGIHREIARDRATHGGTLTRQEYRQVNRDESRASRDIYRLKHNAR